MPKRKKTEGRNSVDLATDFYSNPNANLVSFESVIKSASPPRKPKPRNRGDIPLLPSITQSSNITMAVGTRKSDPKRNIMGSYEGLTDTAKESTNFLANLQQKKMVKGKEVVSKVFPGFTVHSGYRSRERNIEAVLTGKGKLSGYRLAGALTPAQRSAGPATSTKPSPHRESGIEALYKAGYVSKHETANAIDFSYKGYPKNPSEAEKLEIKDFVKKHYPSAKNIIPKKGHIHIAF